MLGRQDYAPFGMDLFAGTGLSSDPRFAELSRDEEAGLDYARARMYQPRTGRFTAPDPVQAGLFEPQRWNRYSYALNNSVVYADADGENPTFRVTVIGRVREAWGLLAGSAGVAAPKGWSVTFWGSRTAKGGGINVLKNGQRSFAADWHQFKHAPRTGPFVSRPHLHYGSTKRK